MGLVLSPFAFYHATKALQLFRASGVSDEKLHAKLKFLRAIAGFLVVFWAVSAILEIRMTASDGWPN